MGTVNADSIKKFASTSLRVIANGSATGAALTSTVDMARNGISTATDVYRNGPGRCPVLDSMKECKRQHDLQKLDERNGFKADLLFRFVNLMEFPNEDRMKEIKVAIVGDPAVREKFLQNVDGKEVRGKKVRFVDINDPKQLKDVDMLCVGPECKNPQSWLGEKRPGLLTVESEGPRNKHRSDFKLYTSNGKVRFDAFISQVRRDQLKISPRMVKVARTLEYDHTPGEFSWRKK